MKFKEVLTNWILVTALMVLLCLPTLLLTSNMGVFFNRMILLWGDYASLEFGINDIADFGVL